MKKLTIVALGLGLLAVTACNNKKAETPAPAPAEQEVIKDSAFQKAAAGDYKSLDGKTVITLGSDFSASTKNYNKEFYKWELAMQPQGSEAVILLDSKGMDTDIKEQAQIDVEEGKIIVKNETFRKAGK